MIPSSRHSEIEFVERRDEPRAYGRWVSTKSLGIRLDAPYFDPAFDEIDALVAARPGEVVQLSDLISQVVHRGGREEFLEEASDDKLPFVAASSISSHAMLDPDRSAVRAEDREKIGAYIESEGIVANTVASRYQFAYYSPTVHGSPVALSSYLALLITDDGIDPAFLASELCQSYVTLQIKRLVRRSFIPKLPLSELLAVRVALPSAPDQSRIANDVRVRASIFASGSAAGGVGVGYVGATFEEVSANIEDAALGLDWVDVSHSRFLEWDSHDRFEKSGRVWGLPREPGGVVSHGVELSSDLRDWVSQQTESFCIFNSCLGQSVVGPEMLSAINFTSSYSRAQLSALFNFIEQIQGEEGRPDSAFIRTALSDHAGIARTFASTDDALNAFATVIRPLLFVAIPRYGQPHGALLLAGPSELHDPEGIYELMRTAGVTLSAQLKSQLALLPEIESLTANRTVTELMHRIKNPLGDIDNAITFLELWGTKRQFMCDLVPDETQARLDAQECGQDLSEFSFGGYLARIRSAKEELSNLSRKLRHLARAETGGEPEWHSLAVIVDSVVTKTIGSRRNISCELERQRELEEQIEVYADADLLITALVNVTENSIREMQHRPPVLEVRAGMADDKCTIEIIDNGLDEEEELNTDPFVWGTTNHFVTGKGSGYGLPMVRKTFNFLNCHCDLEKLVGRPGCRFWGTLPARRRETR